MARLSRWWSINFWRSERSRAYGFVREVLTDCQPKEIDVYKMPASQYIRAYTNKSTALLMSKEQCEIWELLFDTFEHKSGYAYMPVMPRLSTPNF